MSSAGASPCAIVISAVRAAACAIVIPPYLLTRFPPGIAVYRRPHPHGYLSSRVLLATGKLMAPAASMVCSCTANLVNRAASLAW